MSYIKDFAFNLTFELAGTGGLGATASLIHLV